MEEITALAQSIIDKATSEGITICCAESLTGGMLAESLTRISGASVVFAGGVVAYQTDTKISILNVPEKIIAVQGAVSSECAASMAAGVRELFCADYALSTTGVAGPLKDERDNQVGTVFVALAGEDGVGVIPLTLDPQLSRDDIRMQTTMRALKLLSDFL